MNISCSKTGYSSSITFNTKPMYGGVRDHITGEVKHLPSGRVVCRINGQWTEKIEMTLPDNGVGRFMFFRLCQNGDFQYTSHVAFCEHSACA